MSIRSTPTRPRGHPPQRTERRATVSVRVTEAERARLEEDAAKAGRDLSALLRRRLLHADETRTTPLADDLANSREPRRPQTLPRESALAADLAALRTALAQLPSEALLNERLAVLEEALALTAETLQRVDVNLHNLTVLFLRFLSGEDKVGAFDRRAWAEKHLRGDAP